MLRVLTIPLRVARDAAAVYENANAEAILVVLMHKISQAAAADGLRDARALLRAWLTNLCSKHNLARAAGEGHTLDSLDQVGQNIHTALQFSRGGPSQRQMCTVCSASV